MNEHTAEQSVRDLKVDVEAVEASIEAMKEEGTELISLKQAVRNLYYDNPDFKYDRRFQYMSKGKLYQYVAKLPPDRHAMRPRPIPISVCINHTPKAKYNGEALRKIRTEKGVGRPPLKPNVVT